MRLSPLDIHHAAFDTGIGGYNKNQVRNFLERVSDDHEQTLREVQALREELQSRSEELEELRTSEVELKRAVIAAERIANEIMEQARRDAQLIVREAEARKDEILREAEGRLREARAELSRLEKQQHIFREQFRGMIKAFERSLDSVPAPKVVQKAV